MIGTKSGQLELYDLGSSVLLETIDAHAGAIWALAARPSTQLGAEQQICTGSADHDVKFWEVEFKLDPEYSATQKRVTLESVRTLTMTDDVLAVKYSPDGKLLAVSLLDATVKIFYEDTLKFFLSLCVLSSYSPSLKIAAVNNDDKLCMYYPSGPRIPFCGSSSKEPNSLKKGGNEFAFMRTIYNLLTELHQQRPKPKNKLANCFPDLPFI